MREALSGTPEYHRAASRALNLTLRLAWPRSRADPPPPGLLPSCGICKHAGHCLAELSHLTRFSCRAASPPSKDADA